MHEFNRKIQRRNDYAQYLSYRLQVTWSSFKAVFYLILYIIPEWRGKKPMGMMGMGAGNDFDIKKHEVKLQNKYNVSPEKLIAAGRSSYNPIAENDTRDNQAKNRRTRIVILPNINKFFALIGNE